MILEYQNLECVYKDTEITTNVPETMRSTKGNPQSLALRSLAVHWTSGSRTLKTPNSPLIDIHDLTSLTMSPQVLKRPSTFAPHLRVARNNHRLSQILNLKL